MTQQRNYPLLHQNGTIYWLQRDVDKLPTDGRPLSVDLKELYRVRKDMYETFADHLIDNNGDIHSAVLEIRRNHK